MHYTAVAKGGDQIKRQVYNNSYAFNVLKSLND